MSVHTLLSTLINPRFEFRIIGSITIYKSMDDRKDDLNLRNCFVCKEELELGKKHRRLCGLDLAKIRWHVIRVATISNYATATFLPVLIISNEPDISTGCNLLRKNYSRSPEATQMN